MVLPTSKRNPHAARAVFFLDPDNPGETRKPEEVIRGSGGWKSPPARSRGQSPWWRLGDNKSPQNWGLGQSPQNLNRF